MQASKALIVTIALGLPSSGLAQTSAQSDPYSHGGLHQIELSLGLLSALNAGSDVSIGGVGVTSQVSGIIGSLAYGYWITDEWAVTLSVGIANADASTSASGSSVAVESAAVIPMLFGLKYKPVGLAVADALRPYLSVSIGPYLGLASDVRAGTTTGTESYSEAAIGARAAIGMELSLSRRFALGLMVGYHLVSEFEKRIGSETNPSSPEFSLSASFLIGKGKE
jgi:outer membrane protein W